MGAGKRLEKPRLERLALARELVFGLRARMDERLQPLGITLAQLRVLWTVELHPEANGAEVSRLCAMTPQSGQALLAKMEAAGWLRRHAGAQSERVRVAEVTAKGRKLLEKARAMAEAMNAEIWKGIPEADLKCMEEVLRKAVARMDSIA